MGASLRQSPASPGLAYSAQVLIFCGLLILMVDMWWPAAPAVTAFAFVAWGATRATAERFRSSPALVPVLCMHLAIYGGLYVLFLGATLHAAARDGCGLGIPAAIDLAASVGPVVGVLCVARGVLCATRLAE
jgi:hypothetical protein